MPTDGRKANDVCRGEQQALDDDAVHRRLPGDGEDHPGARNSRKRLRRVRACAIIPAFGILTDRQQDFKNRSLNASEHQWPAAALLVGISR